MILWTIRHTKPHNPKDVCYGRLDFDVSPSFADEFSKPIEALKQFGARPEVFYSSPLLRCRRLADKVSAAMNLNYRTEQSIIEVDFGAWENQKLSLIDRQEMKAWKANLRGYKFPGGESFFEVDKRVSAFLEKCFNENKETLWVTHAGVIASLMHTFSGVPHDDFIEGRFSYAMVTRFEFQKENGILKASFENVYHGIPMKPLDM